MKYSVNGTFCISPRYGPISSLLRRLSESKWRHGVRPMHHSLHDRIYGQLETDDGFLSTGRYLKVPEINIDEQDCSRTANINHHGLYSVTRILFRLKRPGELSEGYGRQECLCTPEICRGALIWHSRVNELTIAPYWTSKVLTSTTVQDCCPFQTKEERTICRKPS